MRNNLNLSADIVAEILINLVHDYPKCSTEWYSKAAGVSETTVRRTLLKAHVDGHITVKNTGFGYFVRYAYVPFGMSCKWPHNQHVHFYDYEWNGRIYMGIAS